MSLPRFVAGMVSIGLMVVSAGVVYGQTTSTGSGQAFPNKPIRIVTGEPGGGSDFTTRVVAQGLAASLGQPVVVDNRPTGPIQEEIVSRAPPDGYTLLLVGSSHWIGPLLQKMSYDPVTDFLPITIVDRTPQVLVVHPSVSANSVKELIALAKARPGALNYASSGAGGMPHLAGELFKGMAGVNIVRISYKGGGAITNAVVGGEVSMTFQNASTLAPHIKAGRLRALAVTSAQPSALAPGLPTVAASGLPGFESVSIACVFAPAKTPASIITRLNQEIVRFISRADVRERELNAGLEVVGSSPQELAASIKSDMARWGKLIKDADIRAE